MKKLYLLLLMLLLLFIPVTNAVAVYQLDQPISELNGHTLREVYEQSLVLNPSFRNGINGWSNSNSIFTVNESIVLVQAIARFGGLRQDINSIIGNQQYLRVRWKPSSTTQRIMHQQFTTENYQPTSVNTWQEYIKIDIVTSNPEGAIRLSDNGSSSWQPFEADYYYVIDMTALGIANLSQVEMDKYFNFYLEAVRFENENLEASQDVGGYQNIFRSIINGVKNLIVEMGNVWQFLNAPIITSDMQDYKFSIDWSWDIIEVIRQLFNSLSIILLQISFILPSLMFSFLGIPVQISILSLLFSNLVFLLLGWIMVKSFII